MLQDRSWKGEGVTYDKSMAKRPSDNNRKCTDVLCCLIFTAFLGSMGFCTIYGYVKGNPGKLIAPIAADN